MENFNIGKRNEKEHADVRDMANHILGDGKITMTHSCVFTRGGEKVVHVCFERVEDSKRCFAEGVVPACTFLHNDGFLDEEIEALKIYLQMNKDEIYNNARQINRSVLFKL